MEIRIQASELAQSLEYVPEPSSSANAGADTRPANISAAIFINFIAISFLSRYCGGL